MWHGSGSYLDISGPLFLNFFLMDSAIRCNNQLTGVLIAFVDGQTRYVSSSSYQAVSGIDKPCLMRKRSCCCACIESLTVFLCLSVRCMQNNTRGTAFLWLWQTGSKLAVRFASQLYDSISTHWDRRLLPAYSVAFTDQSWFPCWMIKKICTCHFPTKHAWLSCCTVYTQHQELLTSNTDDKAVIYRSTKRRTICYSN